MQTALVSYASNNRGSLPTSENLDNFLSQYLVASGDTFIDPLGGSGNQSSTMTTYEIKSVSGDSTEAAPSSENTFAPNQNIIFYTVGYTCESGGAIKKIGNRKVAIRMYLEGGGVACYNN